MYTNIGTYLNTSIGIPSSPEQMSWASSLVSRNNTYFLRIGELHTTSRHIRYQFNELIPMALIVNTIRNPWVFSFPELRNLFIIIFCLIDSGSFWPRTATLRTSLQKVTTFPERSLIVPTSALKNSSSLLHCLSANLNEAFFASSDSQISDSYESNHSSRNEIPTTKEHQAVTI